MDAIEDRFPVLDCENADSEGDWRLQRLQFVTGWLAGRLYDHDLRQVAMLFDHKGCLKVVLRPGVSDLTRRAISVEAAYAWDAQGEPEVEVGIEGEIDL